MNKSSGPKAVNEPSRKQKATEKKKKETAAAKPRDDDQNVTDAQLLLEYKDYSEHRSDHNENKGSGAPCEKGDRCPFFKSSKTCLYYPPRPSDTTGLTANDKSKIEVMRRFRGSRQRRKYKK